ncbi:MAG: efflux RND transporter permease subunit [Candidatus Binatia bacterium]|nr:efflux RND transporter permease subunit [Candidatus Binatia bacterium]
MKAAIAWFARNSVAANLLMLVIVVGGLLALPRLKMEIFPAVEADLVLVTVPYRGASPSEVEKGVCIRVEERIQGIEGIERLDCTASEGMGLIMAEVHAWADTDGVLDDIKTEVDAIDTFPAETDNPIIKRATMRARVINVAVYGDVGERTLREYGQKVRDDIAELPGITVAKLRNTRNYEISIEVSESDLGRHALTFDDVVGAVQRSSLDLPAGSIKTSAGEISLRTKGQAYSARDFENIVLVASSDGSRVLVGDVARVIDGFEDTDRWAIFDGQPSVMIQVYRVGDQGALDVAAQVKKYIGEAQASLPPGLSVTTWQDESVYLRARLNTLLANGRLGFFLIFGVLAMFLRLRLAFWVGLGVPIAMLGTFIALPWFDVSINLLSLFAFLVVLGILVDDAIVVGENIHTHQEKGEDPVESAIEGAQEVAVPVTFGVLTTIAAFSPLLMIPGDMGKMTRQIPIVVITALVFSFIESKMILPAHLAHARARGNKSGAWSSAKWKRFQAGVVNGLERFTKGPYARFLQLSVDWRYSTAAAGAALLLITAGLVGGGWVRFHFMPAIEGDNVVAFVTLPQGTPADVTAKAIKQLEASADAVRAELDGAEVVKEGSVFHHTLSSVGEQPYRKRQERESSGSLAGGANEPHTGEVNIELAPSETRGATSLEVANLWREKTGAIPDAVELGFTSAMFDAGEALHVELRGQDGDGLRDAAAAVRRRLEQYPGVYDVTDSFRGGKQEVALSIRDSAEALGLSLQDLARQVRQAFYGDEAQRIQRGRDDVRVMVRYPRESRRSLGDVEQMRVRMSDGTAVPFSSVGDYELDRGYSTIYRADRRRIVSVTADVNPNVASPNDIAADLSKNVLPALLADFEGITYAMQGEQAEQAEFGTFMLRGFGIAMLVIFALLAIPLGSYVQPLIIMTAIPFGMVGAIFGHLIMNWDLSMFSVIGMVAVSGVVVNDSLVLVDYVNRMRAKGLTPVEAVQQAGMSRLRPIILTSLTTFAGLSPLLAEQSVQAQFLIPMAISLAFGVLFATVVTLVLVPTAYMIVEDANQFLAGLRGAKEDSAGGEDPTPAH